MFLLLAGVRPSPFSLSLLGEASLPSLILGLLSLGILPGDNPLVLPGDVPLGENSLLSLILPGECGPGGGLNLCLSYSALPP